MLISYRDSKRYPSEDLALKAWVRVAEALARQVVCHAHPRGFDPLRFSWALELCRGLTCRPRPRPRGPRDPRGGPEAIRRVVTSCAAAGVLLTNGQARERMRFEPGHLAAGRLRQRDRDLDAEERDMAA